MTATVWRRSVKSWGCRYLVDANICDFSAWRAGTNEPVQCGKESAHKSRAASGNTTLGDCMRRGQHLQEGEHQRGLGEASYCGLCLAKTVRRCFCACTNILLTHMFFRHQHSVDNKILLTPIFCRRQYFVDSYILLTPIFC